VHPLGQARRKALIRAVLVGLGRISAVHKEALAMIGGVEIVAGVETRQQRAEAARRSGLAVYSTLADALSSHRCDVVIVATPTLTHLDLCRQALDLAGDAEVLVEKPLGVDAEAVDQLLDAVAASGRRLHVLYHSSHAPEVAWGVARATEIAATAGTIQAIEAAYCDPYVVAPRALSDGLASSWVDSGVNALSVLDRFVQLEAVTTLRTFAGRFSTFEAHLSFASGCRAGSGSILTSWQVTESTKITRITFADGTVLVLDHTAVSGRLLRGNAVVDIFSGDPTVPRLVAHYTRMFDGEFAGVDEGEAAARDRRLHRLLLSHWPPR
jgi:predicted dehydrogenase